MTVYDDGLDERDPTPAEYDDFKEWFAAAYPAGDVLLYQRLYRAYQAGHQQGRQVPSREAGREPGS